MCGAKLMIWKETLLFIVFGIGGTFSIVFGSCFWVVLFSAIIAICLCAGYQITMNSLRVINIVKAMEFNTN